MNTHNLANYLLEDFGMYESQEHEIGICGAIVVHEKDKKRKAWAFTLKLPKPMTTKEVETLLEKVARKANFNQEKDEVKESILKEFEKVGCEDYEDTIGDDERFWSTTIEIKE